MNADLTCPSCAGSQRHPVLVGRCWDCTGGRRRPTLAEWDALVADRDRLDAALRDAHLARVEAQNPGIDMDEVRRRREEFGPAQDWTGASSARGDDV